MPLDTTRTTIKVPFSEPVDFLDELGKYNWHQVDPAFARLVILLWGFWITLYLLYRSPRAFRLVRTGRAWQGRGIWSTSKRSWWGLKAHAPRTSGEQNEHLSPPSEVTPLNANAPGVQVKRYVTIPRHHAPAPSVLAGKHAATSGFLYIPAWSNLEIGHILIVMIYLALMAGCTFYAWPDIVGFPNRAGFTAICQLPFIIIFGTKNSILALFLGHAPGYYFNYLHRWSGRGMFLFGSLHSVLWVIKRFRTGRVERLYTYRPDLTGIGAFFVMCAIVGLSLQNVRRRAYRLFYASHVLSNLALFVLLYFHTKWKFTGRILSWSAAFYMLDLAFRLLKLRVRSATLEAVDDQMTLIHVTDCADGWVGGQHVNVRFLGCSGLKESHPFTILNVPESISAIPTKDRPKSGIILAARVMGSWTKALNDRALAATTFSSTLDALHRGSGLQTKPVKVLIEGPYSSGVFDCGRHERLVLIAGGSGATFAIGLLDEIVGRVVKHGRRDGEKTTHIEFIWYIRNHTCISWFSPILADIANATIGTSISIRFHFYITRESEDIKADTLSASSTHSIPNTTIEFSKPHVCALLREYLCELSDDLEGPPLPTTSPTSPLLRAAPHNASDTASPTSPLLSSRCPESLSQFGGGVGVAACGPSSLCRDVQNCIASLPSRVVARVGGVDLHVESFAI